MLLHMEKNESCGNGDKNESEVVIFTIHSHF